MNLITIGFVRRNAPDIIALPDRFLEDVRFAALPATVRRALNISRVTIRS